jgi:molecular chaperone DnaK
MTKKSTRLQFGIDFGTTNTAVVSWDGFHLDNVGDPSYAGKPFPSVVAIDALTGEISCGGAAKDKAIEMIGSGSHKVASSVKRVLVADELVPGPGGRQWTAEEIAAELFKELSRTAEQHYGTPIEQAVVAIPVGMPAENRAALRRAARKGGIEVTSFISESTAAYFSNAQRDPERFGAVRYSAVFDWGGGTLDVSVLESRKGRIAERHTVGWETAGDHIDLRLAEFIHEKICQKFDLRTPFDSVAPKDRQLLVTEAERCKLRLQAPGRTASDVELGSYLGAVRKVEVTRAEFEDLTRVTVRDAVDQLFTCIERSKLAPEEIGALIVVGGSSKLRLLHEEINARWLWNAPIFPDEAEWDIARGAALLAANPGIDELAESVGLILADDRYHAVFDEGRSVGAKFDRSLGLVEDTQSATFVFATKRGDTEAPRRTGYIHLPVLGFSDEVIELKASITKDLVFEATARSHNAPNTSQTYKYDELRWRYQLPQLGAGDAV